MPQHRAPRRILNSLSEGGFRYHGSDKFQYLRAAPQTGTDASVNEECLTCNVLPKTRRTNNGRASNGITQSSNTKVTTVFH
ncbi:hypothetical protein K0M31_013075, partial [Melipona bicolor]